MAFCARSLRIVACAGNFTLWHYHTRDSALDITQSDYFAEACCIRNGDILIIENKCNDEDIAIKLYAVSHQQPVEVL